MLEGIRIAEIWAMSGHGRSRILVWYKPFAAFMGILTLIVDLAVLLVERRLRFKSSAGARRLSVVDAEPPRESTAMAAEPVVPISEQLVDAGTKV